MKKAIPVPRVATNKNFTPGFWMYLSPAMSIGQRDIIMIRWNISDQGITDSTIF